MHGAYTYSLLHETGMRLSVEEASGTPLKGFGVHYRLSPLSVIRRYQLSDGRYVSDPQGSGDPAYRRVSSGQLRLSVDI